MSTQTITIDDIQYNTTDLAIDVQELIGIHQVWSTEKDKIKLEDFKLEAAMKAVSEEIQARIRNFEKMKKDQAESVADLAKAAGLTEVEEDSIVVSGEATVEDTEN